MFYHNRMCPCNLSCCTYIFVLFVPAPIALPFPFLFLLLTINAPGARYWDGSVGAADHWRHSGHSHRLPRQRGQLHLWAGGLGHVRAAPRRGHAGHHAYDWGMCGVRVCMCAVHLYIRQLHLRAEVSGTYAPHRDVVMQGTIVCAVCMYVWLSYRRIC